MQLAVQGPGVAPAQAMAKRANELLPFSSATTVVDMGCGPGQVTAAILQEYASALPAAARVVAADNSPQMLAQFAARKQKEEAGGSESWARVETVTTDIHNCAEFDNESITHLLAGFTLFLIPEPLKALESIKLKLASGGVFAFSAWESSDWQDLMYYPKKVRADLDMPYLPNDWTDPESVRKTLQDTGLQDVEVVQTEGYWPITDYDETCRFVLTKLPLPARFTGQMSDEEVRETHKLMVSDLKAKYPALPVNLVGKATLAFCRK